MDIFESYKTRYNEFTTFTEFNLEDRLKQIPYEKGYWASELNTKKRDLDKLHIQKKKTLKNLLEKVISDSVVTLNKKTLDNIEESEVVQEINLRIQTTERLVELLEMFYKCISYINQDIHNILELKKLD